MNGGKKSTTYTWNARSSQDCIKDLITLCQSLQHGLEARYDNIVPSSVKKLCKVFDLEEVVKHIYHYKVVDGKIESNGNRVEVASLMNSSDMVVPCHMLKPC